MKLNFPEEWFRKSAKSERDSEIGAGTIIPDLRRAVRRLKMSKAMDSMRTHNLLLSDSEAIAWSGIYQFILNQEFDEFERMAYEATANL